MITALINVANTMVILNVLTMMNVVLIFQRKFLMMMILRGGRRMENVFIEYVAQVCLMMNVTILVYVNVKTIDVFLK